MRWFSLFVSSKSFRNTVPGRRERTSDANVVSVLLQVKLQIVVWAGEMQRERQRQRESVMNGGIEEQDISRKKAEGGRCTFVATEVENVYQCAAVFDFIELLHQRLLRTLRGE